jgi:ABC-type antimicrobial peptide transport system permease subunit
MEGVVAASIAFDRFVAALVGAFGLLALLLGAVGVYGVAAHGVQRRTQEFGVRMALGSDRHRVLYDAMRAGLRPVVWGVLAGLAGAFAAGRALRSLLFDLAPTDPLTWTLAVGGLLVVAALACYLPARRITALDPVQALRSD